MRMRAAGLAGRLDYLFDLLDQFVGLLVHGIERLGSLALTSQLKSIQRFPSHETGPRTRTEMLLERLRSNRPQPTRSAPCEAQKTP